MEETQILKEALAEAIQETYLTINRLYTGESPKLLLSSYGARTWYWYEIMVLETLKQFANNTSLEATAKIVHSLYFNHLEPEDYILWENEPIEHQLLWKTVVLSTYTVYKLNLT